MTKVKPVLRIHHPRIFHSTKPDKHIEFSEYADLMQKLDICEFGFGKGSFIINQAKENPDKQFLAVEATPSLFFSTLKKAASENLPNLYLGLGDARLTTTMYLTESTLQKIYFMFPDPWRKTKHFNRRMVSELTAPYLINTLAEKGQIIIRSDNHIVFFDALTILIDAGMKLIELSYNYDVENAYTEWERKAIRANRVILQVKLQKPENLQIKNFSPIFDERQIGLRFFDKAKILYSGAVTAEHKQSFPEIIIPKHLLK